MIQSNTNATALPIVRDADSMLHLIQTYGLIPFFANPIPGFSVQEHTPPECWFTGDNLGPWDWKIDCIQSGDIAYGKYLWGGKAAFATVAVYRELVNWRRSLPKFTPTVPQQTILDLLEKQGSLSVADVRKCLGINKGAADALLTRLQMQGRVITGDITRVYRGPNLTYNGWQRSTFCTPEALFEDLDFPFPGFRPRTFRPTLSPAASLDFLKETIHRHCGDVPDRLLARLLG